MDHFKVWREILAESLHENVCKSGSVRSLSLNGETFLVNVKYFWKNEWHEWERSSWNVLTGLNFLMSEWSLYLFKIWKDGPGEKKNEFHIDCLQQPLIIGPANNGPAPYNFKILCFQKHIKHEQKPSIILKKSSFFLCFFLSLSFFLSPLCSCVYF